MIKKYISFVIALLIGFSVYAQSPQTVSYQAIVRDAFNDPVVNSTVTTQISILQGSAAGTAIFVETHSVSTNANGLLTTQIGAGTVVSGDFSAIDWAQGPYFIKSETDPSGGTSYTITNTSQILSVPYALHSETAASATTIDGEITKAYIEDLDQRLAALEPDPAIGDYRYGGIVFYIDPLNPKHGLVVSLENQNNNVKCKWSVGGNILTGASGTAVGTGATNTAAIIAAHGEGNYAAYICSTYANGIYKNWFLPSPDECYAVYENIAVVNPAIVANGGTAVSGIYWTSKEQGQDYAATKYLSSGGGGGAIKGLTVKIRAIRAF